MARRISSVLGLILVALLPLSVAQTIPTCTAATTTAPMTVVPQSARVNTTGVLSEACPVAKDKFMYNVWQGPPNMGAATTGSNRPVGPESSRTGNATTLANLWWFANMTCGNSAGMSDPNGLPLGCCTNVQLPVLTGCYKCAGTATQLPSGVSATNVVIVNGAQTSGTLFSPSTDNTLRWPQATASDSMLGPGLYTFQLWAESLCGKDASKTISLAARCPPSPMVKAVIRTALNGAVSTYDTTQNAFLAQADRSFFVDASCSMPFLIQKEGTAWSTNAYRNLYAIQSVWFTVVDTTILTLTAGGTTTSASTPTVTLPFNANGMLGVTGSLLKPETNGNIIITVSDGCSAAQQQLTVFAKCGCKPTANAAATSTAWTNVPSTMTTQPGASNANNNPGTGANTVAFKLNGQSSTTFDLGTTANLDYDWSFVNWLPDYSDMWGTGTLLSQINAGSSGNFPPTAKANCGGSLSDSACPATAGAASFGLTASACCFAASDVVNGLAGIARPAVNNYVYKVLQINSGAGNTMTKEYNFMRIAGACASSSTVGTWAQEGGANVSTTALQCFDANQNAVACSADKGTLDTSLNARVSFVALPSFMNTMIGTTMYTVQDFNIPDRGVDGQGASKSTKFLPTTQCSAWMRILRQSTVTTTTQTKTVTALTCNGQADLLLCKVTIAATGAGLADLKVSSFGSCRGAWQFMLTVSDVCQKATDTFALNVGCNRKPNVIAGCSNAQVWDGQKFEQISLDGRASWDPDNFGDAFNGLAAPSLNSNGGLGAYGLTYAWALVSAPATTNWQAGNSTNCPLNVNAVCTDDYCCTPGATTSCYYSYPMIDLTTNMWANPSAWPGVSRSQVADAASASPIIARPNPMYANSNGGYAFGGSLLGEATLFQAWGSTNVQYSQPTTPPANNTIPAALDASVMGPSPFSQRLFPMFNKGCAPTVYPMFVNVAGPLTNTGLYSILPAQGAEQFTANDQTAYNTNSLWKSVQQLQHQGNTAYIQGLRYQGAYVARLYAFDGCSVGYGDVTFTTKCSTVTMETAQKYNNFGVNATYTSGSNLAGFEFKGATGSLANQFSVRYDGLPSNTLSGSASIVWRTNGVSGAQVATCAVTQEAINGGERVMKTTTDCVKNMITALAPGNYGLQVTVSDGCISETTAMVTIDFSITCSRRIQLAYNEVPAAGGNRVSTTTNPQSSNYYMYNLQYVPPPVNSGTGTFPAFKLPISSWSETNNAGTWTRDTSFGIDLTFNVFFNQQFCNVAGSCKSFPSNSLQWGWVGNFTLASAKSNTNVDNEVDMSQSIRNALTFPGNTGGGSAFLSNALAWDSTRTRSTSTNQQQMWNTVLSAAQSLFRSTTNTQVFQWSGTYMISVAASLTGGNTCTMETKVGTPPVGNAADTRPAMQLYVSYVCDDLSDPSLYLNSTDANGNMNGPVSTMVNFDTNANTWCEGQGSTEAWCTATSVAGAFADTYVTAASWSRKIPTVSQTPGNLQGSCPGGSGFQVVPVVGGNAGTAVMCSGDAWTTTQTVTAATLVGAYAYYPMGLGGYSATQNNGGTSTVSFVPSYVSATAAASWAAASSTASNQNPLLLSPLSFANFARGFQTVPVVANVQPAKIRLGMPGTWKIDVYGTNGCSNTSSANGFNLLYYCPRNTLPTSVLQYEVKTSLAPAAGQPASPNIAGDRVVMCGTAAGTGLSNITYGSPNRRRVLGENDETSSRKLLQNGHFGDSAYTAGTTGAFDNAAAKATCALNDQTLSSTAYQLSNGGTIPGSQPLLRSNYDSYVPIFFDSFAVPAPATGTTTNWFGMGQLWANAATLQGVGYNIFTGATRPQFQGKFETLTLTSPSFSNNKMFSWMTLSDWSTTYTCGSSSNCLTPIGGTAQNGQCSWSRPANSWNNANIQRSTSAIPPATFGSVNPLMQVNGCNTLGQGTAIPASTQTTMSVADAGWASMTVQSAANAVGIIATRQTFRDVQLIAWNGNVGASCYDYRAVRIVARCNVLFPMTNPSVASGPSTGTGMGTYSSAALQAQYPDVHINGATAPATSATATWSGSNFDSVELEGKFNYYQCGMYSSSINFCGSAVQNAPAGSTGNLFSLIYSWSLLSSPVGSWYMMGNNGMMNTTVGAGVTTTSPESVVSITNSTTPAGTTTVTKSARTVTTVTDTQTNEVKLVNHAFNLPRTCIRPDLEGQYTVRLDIDDGCSTWRSNQVTITATCPPLPASETALNAKAMWPGQAWSPIDATMVTASVKGDVFNRITVQIAPAASTPSAFYTYSWSLTQPTGYDAVSLTNSQGTMVSFVPGQMPMSSPQSSTAPYILTVKITNNCLTTSGTSAAPKTQTYTFKIAVTCTLTNMLFQFKAPMVKTSATSTDINNYWQGSPPPTSAASSAIPEYGYYNDRAVALTDSTTGACDLSGPFCSPTENGNFPTVLFGGSLPTSSASTVIPGFQKYYFEVAATVTSTCVVKKTYWVLTGYKNAQSFTPTYLPAVPPAPAAAVVTCSPTQTWTLTIEGTPCKPCTTDVSTEAGVRDICLFRNYSDYTNRPFSNDPTLNTPTSEYQHPLFYEYGASTPTIYQVQTPSRAASSTGALGGTQYSGVCIYDPNERKSGDSFIQARRDNCLVSGKGRSVSILASAAGTNPSTVCTGTGSSRICPMSLVQFVPRFPGVYMLSFDISDSCGPPVSTPIKITAQCKSKPQLGKNFLKSNNFQQLYYCTNTTGPWGDPNSQQKTANGAFEALKVSDYLNINELGLDTTTVTDPPQNNFQCQVTAPSTVMNCSDVRALVNSKNVAVDATGSDNFKACCTCMFGQSTINVFSVTGGTTTSSRANAAPTVTQPNLLALSEAEYNKNYVILVSIVAPLAVVLVASLAGNVLMLLKLRQGSSTAYSAVDVASPRTRVDV